MKQLLLPIILALNASYIYFWLVVVYARSNQHIDRTTPADGMIERLAYRAKKKGDPYLFTIQITTKGGSLDVVKRGIAHALKATVIYPALLPLLRIEVITEDASEAEFINTSYAKAKIPVVAYLLPPDYETPGGTLMKARALHYMVEMHRANPRDAYIVHYDEESVFTVTNLARLVSNLLLHPVGISEGSISYGLDWRQAHILCRTMESNRPFGCHECYLMMTHPAPLHLHGSNLVIQEQLENQIGWDIGLYNGHALIAEDLVFGLMAYQAFGKEAFGWHHVEMIEQPPFTTKAAFKQRERWVLGALQGVNHVRQMPGYKKLSAWDRFKVQVIIRVRVVTYAIGLPVSIISLMALVWQTGAEMLDWSMTGQWHFHLVFLALPGLFMWLGATQIGLWQNLRYTDLRRHERILEHIKVLLVTPIAGLYDTAGPFVAVCRWVTGTRGIAWKPTPKLVGQEYQADPVA
jgi:egghead protein (zeste-white 4 protein)